MTVGFHDVLMLSTSPAELNAVRDDERFTASNDVS